MRARIVVMKSDPSSAIGFPDFLEDNCQTNGCYHPVLTVLRCSNGTIAICTVFPKKQAIICLEVILARAIFVGFRSS